MSLQDPETQKIVLAVLRWERIRAEKRQDSQPVIPTDADAWHSALLERLLEGKEPFPKPPPLSFAYPWYSLCEQGWAVAGSDQWENPSETNFFGPDALYFQQSVWHILERYQSNSRPAWRVYHSNGWYAQVEWEDGPFSLGRTILPVPHDIMGPAYIVRLTDEVLTKSIDQAPAVHSDTSLMAALQPTKKSPVEEKVESPIKRRKKGRLIAHVDIKKKS